MILYGNTIYVEVSETKLDIHVLSLKNSMQFNSLADGIKKWLELYLDVKAGPVAMRPLVHVYTCVACPNPALKISSVAYSKKNKTKTVVVITSTQK